MKSEHLYDGKTINSFIFVFLLMGGKKTWIASSTDCYVERQKSTSCCDYNNNCHYCHNIIDIEDRYIGNR